MNKFSKIYGCRYKKGKCDCDCCSCPECETQLSFCQCSLDEKEQVLLNDKDLEEYKDHSGDWDVWIERKEAY